MSATRRFERCERSTRITACSSARAKLLTARTKSRRAREAPRAPVGGPVGQNQARPAGRIELDAARRATGRAPAHHRATRRVSLQHPGGHAEQLLRDQEGVDGPQRAGALATRRLELAHEQERMQIGASQLGGSTMSARAAPQSSSARSTSNERSSSRLTNRSWLPVEPRLGQTARAEADRGRAPTRRSPRLSSRGSSARRRVRSPVHRSGWRRARRPQPRAGAGRLGLCDHGLRTERYAVTRISSATRSRPSSQPWHVSRCDTVRALSPLASCAMDQARSRSSAKHCRSIQGREQRGRIEPRTQGREEAPTEAGDAARDVSAAARSAGVTVTTRGTIIEALMLGPPLLRDEVSGPNCHVLDKARANG